MTPPGPSPVPPEPPQSSAGKPGRAAFSTCRVTYRMTDQMGVVYYGHYFEIFEIGRTDLLRNSGATYAQMEADGYRLPVVHADCDYIAPARYDDVLEIFTTVGRLTRVRIDFEYEIRARGREGAICRGATHHVIVGTDGRPRRLNAVWEGRLRILAGG